MSPEQIVELTELYERALEATGIRPEEIDRSIAGASLLQLLRHTMWAMPKIREHVSAGKKDKAERWLCWAQGVMCCAGYYSIDDQREHNRSRPDGAAD